ncbi:TRADD-N-associated membrane domain-containing protein [Pseudonocardia sp. HH130630-07]|uniref:TRADD-N-associated membrane domain-containing protein n=1 Tax=Pseudonocardia sp. HH130630-07 TaxID=1690815 RepID=UPI000814CF47|nr:hypothetical protein [Pseudonocardia sp. HH130630-07]ANY07876.1 hypothetical protein AFB00_17975 [Pseudonocardia sp. HH130630-07]
MAAQRFATLAQAGAAAAGPVVPAVVALTILVAVFGVVWAGRARRRGFLEEAAHARQVFAALDGPADPPAGPTVRLSARRRSRPDPAPDTVRTEELDAVTRVAAREAELYLQHHRMALRHHAAYQQASLWCGLLGFSVVLVGATLTSLAGLDVGVVTALAGAIPTAAGGLLLRQATAVGDRAAANLHGLEESVRRFGALHGALAAAAEIEDRRVRDRMYESIGMRMLAPGTGPGTGGHPAEPDSDAG